MNKQIRFRLVFFLSIFFAGLNLYATHITGGELSYEYVSSLTYRIKLKMYRDCMNGEADFDIPARVSVFNSTGSFIEVFDLPFLGATTLPFIPADTIWSPQGNVCVEMATYEVIHTFTQNPAGCTLAYQRCCRTGDIINLANPLEAGSTYWEKIPVNIAINSSPVFDTPPLVLCVNRPMTFDHSAYDADGDSLVYKLSAPYDGATFNNPMPNVASNPPYQQLSYNSSYTASNPMDASPPLTIDSITGIINVTPTLMGNFVVGVACEEYRNGILIGTHYSDFRYSVAYCPWGVGIEDVENISCEVYPNPVVDQVIFNSDKETNIVIYDVLGSVIFQASDVSQYRIVPTVNWPKGIYTYRVFNNTDSVTGKIIKQ